MTELKAFLKMLERSGVGHGIRQDYNPPGTAVLVEHPDDDNETGFWVTDWAFDDAGNLTDISHYRGEPG
jgi:hypothetical protein